MFKENFFNSQLNNNYPICITWDNLAKNENFIETCLNNREIYYLT